MLGYNDEQKLMIQQPLYIVYFNIWQALDVRKGTGIWGENDGF